MTRFWKIRIFPMVLLLAGSMDCLSQVPEKADKGYQDPESLFLSPPESAKPGVLWMWMGSNISKVGIARDLEALKQEGFNRTTMFSLADVTTPWSGIIGRSPTPGIVSWTEPWWQLVRFAAEKSKQLGMDFGMFNCPGYESSGGPWITPELSMQEICWSSLRVRGEGQTHLRLEKPKVDPRAVMLFPVFNPQTGLVEKPVIPARETYYKDIAVLALPDTGLVAKENVIDLSDRMKPGGEIDWDIPQGNWIIYRFGHTTMGTLIQPAQPEATGFECDKMSQAAVDFHMDHVIGEIHKHLGDLIGSGFTHVHFDSYEAGTPTWTPKMPEEFLKRRGYDLIPYLPFFAGRIVGREADSAKFSKDFEATIKDLYRDVYFSTISKKLKAAHLRFLCEPYGGPWRQDEVMPLVDNVMTEFWTQNGVYSPYELDSTVAALRKSGQNIIEAEAFTGDPADSKWDETPEWLKPIGDAAFCAGVNRLVLHRFVEQPWNDRYKPGATMGRWGTHFDRTQTWWKPARAMVKYWQRCQALLQWGRIAKPAKDDFNAVTRDSIVIKSIHRQQQNTDIYFIANVSRKPGTAICSFKVSGKQPELWDPVKITRRKLEQFDDKNGITSFSIPFDKAQSFFIVFRKRAAGFANRAPDFPDLYELTRIKGAWKLQFDSAWGGPAKPVIFDSLQDWINNGNRGIRYYSGTVVYSKTFNVPGDRLKNIKSPVYLDLGIVKHIAHVMLNNKDLGVIWTAPWNIQIPSGTLKSRQNHLVVEVSNVWANRLIGDEQEPDDCEWLPGYIGGGRFLKEFPDWFLRNEQRPSKGRYCFTTWNYFTKNSPLISSGLLGPVRIMGTPPAPKQ